MVKVFYYSGCCAVRAENFPATDVYVHCSTAVKLFIGAAVYVPVLNNNAKCISLVVRNLYHDCRKMIW